MRRENRGNVYNNASVRLPVIPGNAVISRRGIPRMAEVLLAGIGIILCLPLLVLFAFAVRLQDGGPILYRARRVGWRGREFMLLKFRSMVLNADRLGGGLTTSTDDRITSVGRILRQYKLDELPQLLNVLVGDMSVVGPRAEDPRYVARYTPEQRGVLTVRPGITSPASLEYRNESSLLTGEDWEHTYITHILPRKLALDLEYLRKRTVASDILLVLKTVSALFR
jgi:lipopolysaccharide/colanic/teichoic acid biosynthesis glycosyltransferase